MTEIQIPQLERFANKLLGTLCGVLISLPLALQSKLGYLLIVFGALIGFLIGRRYQASRGFMYFAFVCVMVLAWIITFQLGVEV